MLLLGDCLDLLEDIVDDSVDMILTDPPYFLPATHYNTSLRGLQTRKQPKRNFSDLGILESFFKRFFAEVDRILKPSGSLFLFCDGQSYPLFYYHAYFIFHSVRPLIWDKKISFNGYWFRHQHELILFAVREETDKVPTGEGDILRYGAVKIEERKHPAEKPVELILHLIERCSKPNDLILDPFCGSGTTCLAAKRLDRRWIGIELSPDYIQIAKKRLTPYVQQQRLTSFPLENTPQL